MASKSHALSGPNYLGTAIFLSYIVAALVLSFSLSKNISQAYRTNRSQLRNRRNVAIFTLLSLLSFSTLSYNMISVLLHSYFLHAERNGFRPSLGRLGLWTWMVDSSLFEDFANALVADPQRWWWCHAALIVTLHAVLWISQKFNTHSIPHLGKLLLLSQILPISFSLNLAFLTVAVQPARLESRKTHAKVTTGRATPCMIIGSIVVYLLGLQYAPQQATRTGLIPLVLFLRALLSLPYFATPTSYHATAHLVLGTLGVLAQARQTTKVRSTGTHWTELGQAVNSHPAVSALGHDFLIACLSAVSYALVS